jgi:RNA polymerase sigma-54 factor
MACQPPLGTFIACDIAFLFLDFKLPAHMVVEVPMKQTLQLKLGQSLTMTPQLQQAIRLLQLSTLELQQEIQEALDSNLMLELDEAQPASAEERSREEQSLSSQSADPGSGSYDETPPPDDWSGEGQETPELTSSEQVTSEDIPEDMAIETQWDDIYPTGTGTGSGATDSDDENMLETRNAAVESLQDHLLWQLNLTPMSDRDRIIAMTIIDAIEPSGLLNQSVQELFEGLYERWQNAANEAALTSDEQLELDEVQAVLHRVQQFDPPGVAAQDLRDCLLIQLNQLDENTPWLIDAKEVVSGYLDLLASHDYKTLIRKSGIRENTLREAIKLIQTLNPHPGSTIESDHTEYVAPDVYVSKKAGRWRVELNPDSTPRLSINQQYASMIRRADNSHDNTVLKNHLQEARWFLKSLESRNETLLKVASAIVNHQRNFLEYGAEAMKPLVLHEIAELVELHESTVSRVTTNKYIHTPRGLFELKYFFSSHVPTSGGGECSSTAIRAMIKKLVAAENPKKTLSDSQIADLLKEQGIEVARRTIAKYREALNIAPSNERKVLG